MNDIIVGKRNLGKPREDVARQAERFRAEFYEALAERDLAALLKAQARIDTLLKGVSLNEDKQSSLADGIYVHRLSRSIIRDVMAVDVDEEAVIAEAKGKPGNVAVNTMLAMAQRYVALLFNGDPDWAEEILEDVLFWGVVYSFDREAYPRAVMCYTVAANLLNVMAAFEKGDEAGARAAFDVLVGKLKPMRGKM